MPAFVDNFVHFATLAAINGGGEVLRGIRDSEPMPLPIPLHKRSTAHTMMWLATLAAVAVISQAPLKTAEPSSELTKTAELRQSPGKHIPYDAYGLRPGEEEIARRKRAVVAALKAVDDVPVARVELEVSKYCGRGPWITTVFVHLNLREGPAPGPRTLQRMDLAVRSTVPDTEYDGTRFLDSQGNSISYEPDRSTP